MTVVGIVGKARRLHGEGRVHELGACRVFEVVGDHGIYLVIVGGDGVIRCTCPSAGTCSHIAAALLMLLDERAVL